jgi:uncharacterized protein
VGIENRGFASMDRTRQAELASKGGKKAHALGKAHTWTKESARAAGLKGAEANRLKREAAKAAAQS